mgnify:CR=1 FL=1
MPNVAEVARLVIDTLAAGGADGRGGGVSAVNSDTAARRREAIEGLEARLHQLDPGPSQERHHPNADVGEARYLPWIMECAPDRLMRWRGKPDPRLHVPLPVSPPQDEQPVRRRLLRGAP